MDKGNLHTQISFKIHFIQKHLPKLNYLSCFHCRNTDTQTRAKGTPVFHCAACNMNPEVATPQFRQCRPLIFKKKWSMWSQQRRRDGQGRTGKPDGGGSTTPTHPAKGNPNFRPKNRCCQKYRKDWGVRLPHPPGWEGLTPPPTTHGVSGFPHSLGETKRCWFKGSTMEQTAGGSSVWLVMHECNPARDISFHPQSWWCKAKATRFRKLEVESRLHFIQKNHSCYKLCKFHAVPGVQEKNKSINWISLRLLEMGFEPEYLLWMIPKKNQHHESWGKKNMAKGPDRPGVFIGHRFVTPRILLIKNTPNTKNKKNH